MATDSADEFEPPSFERLGRVTSRPSPLALAPSSKSHPHSYSNSASPRHSPSLVRASASSASAPLPPCSPLPIGPTPSLSQSKYGGAHLTQQSRPALPAWEAPAQRVPALAPQRAWDGAPPEHSFDQGYTDGEPRGRIQGSRACGTAYVAGSHVARSPRETQGLDSGSLSYGEAVPVEAATKEVSPGQARRPAPLACRRQRRSFEELTARMEYLNGLAVGPMVEPGELYEQQDETEMSSPSNAAYDQVMPACQRSGIQEMQAGSAPRARTANMRTPRQVALWGRAVADTDFGDQLCIVGSPGAVGDGYSGEAEAEVALEGGGTPLAHRTQSRSSRRSFDLAENGPSSRGPGRSVFDSPHHYQEASRFRVLHGEGTESSDSDPSAASSDPSGDVVWRVKRTGSSSRTSSGEESTGGRGHLASYRRQRTRGGGGVGNGKGRRSLDGRRNNSSARSQLLQLNLGDLSLDVDEEDDEGGVADGAPDVDALQLISEIDMALKPPKTPKSKSPLGPLDVDHGLAVERNPWAALKQHAMSTPSGRTPKGSGPPAHKRFGSDGADVPALQSEVFDRDSCSRMEPARSTAGAPVMKAGFVTGQLSLQCSGPTPEFTPRRTGSTRRAQSLHVA